MNSSVASVKRFLNHYLLDATRDRKDALALEMLVPLSAGYVPWSRSAMRPSAVVALLNDIIINNRKLIVECGPGISTLYIARLLAKSGGRLVSIEHDEPWACTVRAMLAQEKLEHVAEIVYAPLAESAFALDGCLWYDAQTLAGVKATGGIDMLVVDGPPAYTRELRHARYPAVPFFKDAFARDYTVVLDDINRQGEQEIVERWEAMLGIHFDRRFLDGSIAMGRSVQSFGV